MLLRMPWGFKRLKPASWRAATGLVLALAFFGCGGSSDVPRSQLGNSQHEADGSASAGSLDLVAFAVPEIAYRKLIPAFQNKFEGVSFAQSYGPSGEQSRAVEAGQAADVVNFSLAPDMNRLVEADKVDSKWNRGKTKGIVSNSIVTLVVRPGNPKNIQDWSDLLKPGVEVVTPNPFSSGAAKWNLLAPYAAASKAGRHAQRGLDYIEQLLTHVKTQPKSSREASQTFLQGTADALITYENEALHLQDQGERVQQVIPAESILIENPFAVTKVAKDTDLALRFKKFVFSEEGQALWAEAGFRPVNEQVAKKFKSKYLLPKGTLYTIDKLGGWSKVNDDLFDPDKGKIGLLYQASGASTGK